MFTQEIFVSADIFSFNRDGAALGHERVPAAKKTVYTNS